MPASSMKMWALMSELHEAVNDVVMGHPQVDVAEAITRTAAAFVIACARPTFQADALLASAAIFAEMSHDLREKRLN